jgi:hypothetical protein
MHSNCLNSLDAQQLESLHSQPPLTNLDSQHAYGWLQVALKAVALPPCIPKRCPQLRFASHFTWVPITDSLDNRQACIGLPLTRALQLYTTPACNMRGHAMLRTSSHCITSLQQLCPTTPSNLHLTRAATPTNLHHTCMASKRGSKRWRRPQSVTLPLGHSLEVAAAKCGSLGGGCFRGGHCVLHRPCQGAVAVAAKCARAVAVAEKCQEACVQQALAGIEQSQHAVCGRGCHTTAGGSAALGLSHSVAEHHQHLQRIVHWGSCAAAQNAMCCDREGSNAAFALQRRHVLWDCSTQRRSGLVCNNPCALCSSGMCRGTGPKRAPRRSPLRGWGANPPRCGARWRSRTWQRWRAPAAAQGCSCMHAAPAPVRPWQRALALAAAAPARARTHHPRSTCRARPMPPPGQAAARQNAVALEASASALLRLAHTPLHSLTSTERALQAVRTSCWPSVLCASCGPFFCVDLHCCARDPMACRPCSQLQAQWSSLDGAEVQQHMHWNPKGGMLTVMQAHGLSLACNAYARWWYAGAWQNSIL